MIDTHEATRIDGVPVSRRSTRANPFAIGLTAGGVLAGVMAYPLLVAHAEITDYETYDVAAASALSNGFWLLALGSFVALVGAAVIAGVRHELRRG